MMMRAYVRVIAHFMVRQMIGVHVLEFTMRTRAHPVTNAARMILRRRRDEAALAVMAVVTVMSPIPAVMMRAMVVK